MKCNTAKWDRVIRFLVGVITLSYAIAGGPAWMYLGAYFIFTAAWGFCPTYAFFRFSTLSEKNSRHFFN